MGNYDIKNDTHGPKKWADTEKNIATGCSNNCLYCHAKAVSIRFKRTDINGWKDPKMRRSRRKIKPRTPLLQETVMFPSTHDITPEILPECLDFIAELLAAYARVLLVSKPQLQCIAAICERFSEFKDRILFRFTIGSCDPETLRYWEPGAPEFSERLECLKYAHSAGFATSVSCEPMLDEDLRPLLRQIRPYVNDTIILGRLNMPKQHLEENGSFSPEMELRIKGLFKAHDGASLDSLYADAHAIFHQPSPPPERPAPRDEDARR
jgi:DNA repair photolyase